MIARRVNGRARGQGGQTLVEFAFILPIFLLMLMILFDFGRVVYAQHTINQDAREGVRLGIVSTESISTASVDPFRNRYQEIRDKAQVMAPAVPISDVSIFGAPGDCPSPLPSDPVVPGTCFYPYGVTTGDPATPPIVVVRIEVRVDFITPIIANILGGGMTVTAVAQQLIQS